MRAFAKRTAAVLAPALALAATAPLAAAQTAPPPPAIVAAADQARDAAFLALFNRVCMENQEPPRGFETIEWSAFPDDLRFMNTYNHGGTFLRSEQEGAVLYIARTRGPGHMSPGIETRCGIAGQSADHDRLVAALSAQLGADPGRPLEMGGMTTSMLVSRSGAVSVTRTPGAWIIIRNLGIMIAVPRR
ncbi:MAG TPA: hypothetical protein VEW71_01680 [Allosphingosinicella sp.]|nr:hypothetical protein [Allosphingosinicella sp.]